MSHLQKTYYVKASNQLLEPIINISQVWSEPLYPHLSYNFNEPSLGECAMGSDGCLYASYEKEVYESPENFEIVTFSGVSSFEVAAGTYGEYPDAPSYPDLP